MKQVISRLYLGTICFVAWLARRSPYSQAKVLDEFAQDMLSYAPNFQPIPGWKARIGIPWMGTAVCEDIDCKEKWGLVALNGIDRNASLYCPSCEKDTGVLA